MLEDIVNLVVQNGMAVAIIAYFLYKDYRFNEQVLNVLQEIREVLAELKACSSKEQAG